jgi:uncharacterized membrane protein
MMYWNNHMTAGGWIVSIFATVIILALLVAAVLWIARELRDRGERRRVAPSSALEILDRRLASGEIKADRYQELRETIDARPERTRV